MKRRFLAFMLVLCMAAGLLPAAGAAAEGQECLYALDAENQEGSWVVSNGGPGDGMNTRISAVGGVEEHVYCFRIGVFNPEGESSGTAITTDLVSSNTEVVAVTAIDKTSGIWKLTLKAVGSADITTVVDGTPYTFRVGLTDASGGSEPCPGGGQGEGGNDENQHHMNFYNVSFDGERYTVDRDRFWGGFGGSQGDVKYIQVFIGDPADNPTYVTDDLTSGDTNVVTVEKISDGNNVYWKVTFASGGTTTLNYTNGTAYVIDINPGGGGGSEPGPGGGQGEGGNDENQPHMNFYNVSFDGERYTVDRDRFWGGFGGSQGDVKYIQVYIGDPADNPTYVTDDLTSGDTNVVTVEKISDGNNVYWKVTFASGGTTTLNYTNGTAYVIDINPGGGGGSDDPQPGNNACHIEEFQIDNQTYAVGFGFEREDNMLDLYDQRMSGPSVSYTRENGEGSYGGSDGRYYFDYDLYVASVTRQEGENTIYQKTDLTLTVKSLTLEGIDGDDNTFSLAQGNKQVTSAGESTASGQVYYDRTHAGSAKLTAVVQVGETDYTVWFTITCEAISTDTIDCSELTTIQAVNELLSNCQKSDNKIEIVFGAHEYAAGVDGATVITIPELTTCPEPDAIMVRGMKENNAQTTIKGGISYASPQSGQIVDLSFESPETGSGTALVGVANAGPCNVYNCSFTGYATAIDSTKSFIGATYKNIFSDNTVAVHVSLSYENCNQDQWSFNRFIQNTTAVKVDQLNNFITPYYFRLRDSDFIGNGTDFDVAADAGDYYFYRNFFSENGNIIREVIKSEGQGVHLHFYPARAHSITEPGASLIYGSENTVLNSLSGELLVSEIAEGTAINVVEDSGSGASLLATWNFGEGENN